MQIFLQGTIFYIVMVVLTASLCKPCKKIRTVEVPIVKPSSCSFRGDDMNSLEFRKHQKQYQAKEAKDNHKQTVSAMNCQPYSAVQPYGVNQSHSVGKSHVADQLNGMDQPYSTGQSHDIVQSHGVSQPYGTDCGPINQQLIVETRGLKESINSVRCILLAFLIVYDQLDALKKVPEAAWDVEDRKRNIVQIDKLLANARTLVDFAKSREIFLCDAIASRDIQKMKSASEELEQSEEYKQIKDLFKKIDNEVGKYNNFCTVYNCFEQHRKDFAYYRTILKRLRPLSLLTKMNLGQKAVQLEDSPLSDEDIKQMDALMERVAQEIGCGHEINNNKIKALSKADIEQLNTLMKRVAQKTGYGNEINNKIKALSNEDVKQMDTLMKRVAQAIGYGNEVNNKIKSLSKADIEQLNTLMKRVAQKTGYGNEINNKIKALSKADIEQLNTLMKRVDKVIRDGNEIKNRIKSLAYSKNIQKMKELDEGLKKSDQYEEIKKLSQDISQKIKQHEELIDDLLELQKQYPFITMATFC